MREVKEEEKLRHAKILKLMCLATLSSLFLSATPAYCNQIEPATAKESGPTPKNQATQHDRIDGEIHKIHMHIRHGRYKKAHAELQKLASKKHAHPKALTVLGLLYEYGVGCEKNIEKALEYYEAAAEAGLAEAQYELGRLRLSGESSVHDPVKAARALSAAADNGVARAQHLLGTMYLHGRGVEKNEPMAVKWLRRSALQGVDESKQLIETIPGVQQVQKRAKQAGDGYGDGLQNLATSWKGYADLVKSVQSVNQAASGN